MPAGETEKSPSGWTVDTLAAFTQRQIDDLRILLDERYRTQSKALDEAFDAAERAVQAALLATEKAVAKAETATEKRFESVNEFRAQLADQTATFMPRAESISRHDRSVEQIHLLNAKIEDESSRGNEQRAAMENRLLSMIGATNSRLDLTQGRTRGLHDGWGYVVGAIGLAGGIIGIIIGLR